MFFNRFFMIFFMLSILVINVNCGVGVKEAYESLVKTQNDYKSLKETGNITPDHVKPILFYYNKAKESYEVGDYKESVKFAKTASDYCSKSLKSIQNGEKRKGPSPQLLERQRTIKEVIESYITPDERLESYYDNSIEAMKKEDYIGAEKYIKQAEQYLKKFKQLTYLNKNLTLDATDIYKEKYGSAIKVYGDITEDGRLINIVGTIEVGTPIIFHKANRVNKLRRYLKISSADGKIIGWIYQDFIRARGD